VSFLAPLMILGVLGAAIPIVIHLIGRKRAPILKFGAIDFLLGENRRVARRLRLREMILLSLRVLACLAIPLALAKPFFSCAARGPAIQRGPQAAVLVLDDSFVMGYRDGDGTLFEEARARAVRAIDELGPEADVAVLFAADGKDAPVELSRDHLRLKDTIDEARVTARPADLARALRQAAALVTASPLATKRVYLFTAMARASFPPGDPPWPPGTGPELVLIDVSDGTALPNLALVSAKAEKDPDMGARGLRVTADVANYGAQAVKDRAVTLRIGGRAVARGLISIGAGETAQKRFSASLPQEGRGSEVIVELDGDALDVDDRRYLQVELRREVRVLIVDGDPRTVRHDDESFYLETALRPGDRADSALQVTSSTVDDLPRRRLADYDVVFLCNVKALDRARVKELVAWVKAGGGLFVSVGDNVDADAYNLTMAPLLPQELRSPRDVAPGASQAEREGRAERIGRFEATHPIFAVFSARAAGLREARFWKVMLVGPTPDVAERKTLARYSGGAPALIEARLESGRLLLYTSSLDRDWNDLPIHPGYLPLVQQGARYLARTSWHEPEGDLLVGRARELEVGPDDRRLEVTAPSGKKTLFEADRVAGRTSVPFAATAEPGFYRVASARGDGPLRPRSSSDFAVNVDPRGSDTRRIEPASIPGGGAAVAATPTRARRRVELWHALAAALLIVLLGESLITRR
jgi:hypothetical protein